MTQGQVEECHELHYRNPTSSPRGCNSFVNTGHSQKSPYFGTSQRHMVGGQNSGILLGTLNTRLYKERKDLIDDNSCL